MAKPPSIADVARLAKDVENRRVTIEFDRRVGADMHTFEGQGRLAVIGGASLQLTTPSGPVHIIPLAATRRVSVTKRVASTLLGVGSGFVLGLFVPLIVGSLVEARPDASFLPQGMIIGPAAGGFIGLLVGWRTIYTF
jgi:hypothetical protein